MIKRVGILVGHYGAGTGCSWEGRDEWIFAHSDAWEIFNGLMSQSRQTGFEIAPVVISINREMSPWIYIDRAVGLYKSRNIDIRAEWAADVKCDAVVELHYDSFETTEPSGHTIFVNQEESTASMTLATCIKNKFPALGNRCRGIKNASMRILNKLESSGIPCVLIEPAFIFEPGVVKVDWRAKYAAAVRDGILDFINAGIVPETGTEE
jgi:hypothetical protein